MKFSKGNLSWKHKLALGLMFIVPLLIIVGKWSVLPASVFFSGVFSLGDVSENVRSRVVYILFIPFGATLVVLFRLVLGIRLLGPFRSILIAVAFQITGVLLGLIFLAAVTGQGNVAFPGAVAPWLRNRSWRRQASERHPEDISLHRVALYRQDRDSRHR